MQFPMNTSFIDTHCHLFWESFQDDLADVISRAADAGVDRIVIPATSFQTLEAAITIAEVHENVFVGAGIHPHDASGLPSDFISQLDSFTRRAKVIAIGEIGLDYYYDFSPKDVQKAVLSSQIELAKRCRLPVIIHNRESDEDVLALISEHQDGSLKGQFHCFTGDVQFARRVLDVGFHISFTGNVTYKKSTLDDVLRFVPDDRLLIETDSPFMTPTPYRGKRNEPSYLPLIADRFASVRNTTRENIAALTTRNALDLFQLHR